jgi:hypothetical protein
MTRLFMRRLTEAAMRVAVKESPSARRRGFSLCAAAIILFRPER